MTQPSEPKQKPGQDRSAQGKQLLQRAQRAMGGVEKLTAVKDTIHKMEIALEPALGGIKIKQTSIYLSPNQIRQEQEMPFGKVVIYSDGKSGWIVTPQGTQPISPDVLKLAQGVAFRQPTTLMLSDQNSSRSVQAISDNTVEISAAEGLSVVVEFDPATGLPLRQRYNERTAKGEPREKVETFSDWRDVGGIKMPYKAVQQENGTKTLEVTVSEYKINGGITAVELSKKP